MKAHKIIENGFAWVPPEQRASRFGGTVSPRNPESRKPALRLCRIYPGGLASELYLVNHSGECLDSVTATSGGFITVDDDAAPIADDNKFEYNNVMPEAAVKIDEYDGYYDLDYVLQVRITVKSKGLGSIDICPPAKKGGVGEMVLLWDTGESGKSVSIIRG